jgi:uncharacterized protein YjiS (DUF1127 family)
MAFLLSSERPAAAAMPTRAYDRFVVRPAAALIAWYANTSRKAARREAVAALRALDPSRLRDIGLEPSDIDVAAADSSRTLGQVLHAARARNAGR